MKNNKFFLAAIVGGVAFFFLGWLIYGIVMKDTLDHLNPNYSSVMKSEAEMSFPAIILSNLAAGFLFTLILMWANSSNAMSGAKVGAIVGLLMSVSVDFSFLSMTTIMTMSGVFADIILWTIMSAITGAIIGVILGSGQPKTASA